jgi:hypothetical protein
MNLEAIRVKKPLHDQVGLVAAAIGVTGLLYFVSPWLEGVIGTGRTHVLQVVLVALFAVYSIHNFFRFVGAITQRKD